MAYGQKYIIGIQTEFRRMVFGLRERKMFWSSEDRVRARFHYAESRQNKPQVNLWRKSLIKIWPTARNISSEFRRNQTEIKSLTKIFDQNALEYLAFGKDFIMDRLRLEILTKIFRIIFNENISPCSPCDPWIFLGQPEGQKSLEEIFNKIWPMARNNNL